MNRRVDTAFSEHKRPPTGRKPDGPSGIAAGPALLLPPTKAAGEGNLSEEADEQSLIGQQKSPGRVANIHPALNLRRRLAKNGNNGSTLKLMRGGPDGDESPVGRESSAD